MHSPSRPALFAVVPLKSSQMVSALAACLRATVSSRRFPLVVAVHAALTVISSYLACVLRFDGDVPPVLAAAYLQTLPWVVFIRGTVFLPFGLYRGLWRYTSIWDLSRIVLAVFTSSLAIYLLIHQELGPAVYPRSLIAIDSLLLVSCLGGVRLLRRVLPAAVRSNRGRRVLVLGAGDAGEMIVREMQKGGEYRPVGFVDDDRAKVGRTIHGVKVLGTRHDLPRILETTRPSEVLVAIPSATSVTIRGIVQLLERYKLPITTLPGLSELVNGSVGVKHIRPLAIEDLLTRSQVALNTDGVRNLIRGKSVLVTGAGGSIGSELCRQIAALGPARLILFERYENSLYAIENDLADRGTGVPIHAVVGDVTDAGRVESVFVEHRPHLVFHAAAHKHVPLMESHPCEAVKNNIGGTHTIAEAARRHRAERFVLISTDKAANPSSIMGATKRVAELIVQASGEYSDTRFASVRFGNVLGSNGSVIPRMLEQIRAGGPVTVTHPEIRRYFMLIPEAVQLVLNAAVLARDRETFVLDMGEQVKILDVARNLIRLSGFVPDEDIPITFIGLRPGEKLSEALIGDNETLDPAGADKIFRVRSNAAHDAKIIRDGLSALVRNAGQGQTNEVVRELRRLVPTFKPAAFPADVEGVTAPPRPVASRLSPRPQGRMPATGVPIAVPAPAPHP